MLGLGKVILVRGDLADIFVTWVLCLVGIMVSAFASIVCNIKLVRQWSIS